MSFYFNPNNPGEKDPREPQDEQPKELTPYEALEFLMEITSKHNSEIGKLLEMASLMHTALNNINERIEELEAQKSDE